LIYNLLHNKKSYTPSEGCAISSFHHKGDNNCALLGYYAAFYSNFLPMVWDNLLELTKMLTGKPINNHCKSLTNTIASTFPMEFLLS